MLEFQSFPFLLALTESPHHKLQTGQFNLYMNSLCKVLCQIFILRVDRKSKMCTITIKLVWNAPLTVLYKMCAFVLPGNPRWTYNII